MSACMSRSGTTINFDGIQPNMEVSMYSTFQANKSGFLILFYTTSNHLYVVIGCCCCTIFFFYFSKPPSLHTEKIFVIILSYDFHHKIYFYIYTHLHSIIINIIDTMAMRCRQENITKNVLGC